MRELKALPIIGTSCKLAPAGEYNKKTWKYKYKSTAVYANTTFMTLTKEWKEAVGYKRGKW